MRLKFKNPFLLCMKGFFIALKNRCLVPRHDKTLVIPTKEGSEKSLLQIMPLPQHDNLIVIPTKEGS